MRRVLFFSVIIFSGLQSFGQSQGPTCAQTLRLARATYEQGRLQEIEGQLANCIKSPEEGGFSKEDKALRVEAYKILCLSYIYLEEATKADQMMLNILKTDPYFTINEGVDPAEFVALYKTFRTTPIYRIGAKIGANASRPNVVESVSAVELESGSGYSFGVNFQFGATAELPLTFLSDRFTLHGEALYQLKKFDIELIVNRGQDEFGEDLTNTFTGTEAQSWVSIPLIIEYNFLKKKYNPYIGLGVSMDYLIKSEITSERARKDETSLEEKTYDFKPQRNSFNISAIATAGVKFRMAGGYFIGEARFVYGLTQVSSKETSFKNTQYSLEQGYADPVYKLSSLEISIGYVQNIFNPKKLNRKK